MTEDLKFGSFVEYERNRYDKHGKALPELEKENLKFLKILDMGFMNFNKLQQKINKKVIKQIGTTKYAKVKQVLLDKDVIMNFTNSYANHSLASVLQCLANIPEFKVQILKASYQNAVGGSFSVRKPMCSMLDEIFSAYYNDMRVKNFQDVNIEQLSEWMDIQMEKEHGSFNSPEIYLCTIIHAINLETMPLLMMKQMGELKRSNQLVKAYSQKGLMNQLFRVLYKKTSCVYTVTRKRATQIS